MRLQWPCCEELGRLEKQSGDKFRINHDKMINGKKILKRHYLGSLVDALEKLHTVSKIRPDIISLDLYKEIFAHLEKTKKSKDDRLDVLLKGIFELSEILGKGWSSEYHDLIKNTNCPRCKEPIEISFTRIGKDPFRSKGRYNIDDVRIKRGSKHKSRFTSLESRYISVRKGNNPNANKNKKFSHTNTTKLKRKP